MASAWARPTARIFSASAKAHRADALGLALPFQAHPLGVGLGVDLDRLGLLPRLRELRLALVLPHLDGEGGGGDRRLLAGHRLLLAQGALLHGGVLLELVGLHLLDGDLPVAQLLEDLLDAGLLRLGARRADQHLLQVEAVGGELRPHVLARAVLDVGAVLQQLDQRLGLADVLEIGGDHRVERLLHQALDVAEALHHERRLHVVDVHHPRRAAAAARTRPW